MYIHSLNKLKNVGMVLNIPLSTLNKIINKIDKRLKEPKAIIRGDVYIIDLENFFSFIDDNTEKEFFIYTCELEFDNGECSLIVLRYLIEAMINKRWQVYSSIYFAGRKYQLISFYGII